MQMMVYKERDVFLLKTSKSGLISKVHQQALCPSRHGRLERYPKHMDWGWLISGKVCCLTDYTVKQGTCRLRHFVGVGSGSHQTWWLILHPHRPVPQPFSNALISIVCIWHVWPLWVVQGHVPYQQEHRWIQSLLRRMLLMENWTRVERSVNKKRDSFPLSGIA